LSRAASERKREVEKKLVAVYAEDLSSFTTIFLMGPRVAIATDDGCFALNLRMGMEGG
jgi:hypothetical protein